MKAFIIALAFGVALPAVVLAGQKDHGVVPAETLAWGPADASGIRIAVLYGDPTQPGPVAVRVKVPAGVVLPSHAHSQDEFVTVLSGKAKVSWGMKTDPMSGEDLGSGSFFWMKAGEHHALKAIDDLVLELHPTTGPLDMIVDK